MIDMMWIEDAEEAACISSVESRLYAKHDVIDDEISVDNAQDEVHEDDPFAWTTPRPLVSSNHSNSQEILLNHT